MSDVNAELEASVDQVEYTQDVRAHRLDLVVLAPVDIGKSPQPGAVDNSSWLVTSDITIQ